MIRRRAVPRRLVVVLLVLALACAGCAADAAAPVRQEGPPVHYTPPVRRSWQSLDSAWRFHLGDVAGAEAAAFDDRTWSQVDTPHTWNAVDGADGGGNYHRGVGWYRRQCTVAASDSGRRLVLAFGAANQVADVWVNGVYLGRHSGGYAEFRFDATAAMHAGSDNVVAVRVDNSYDAGVAPLSADYTMQGGLYRHVALWTVDPLGVDMFDNAGPGVYLSQARVSRASARVQIDTQVSDGAGGERAAVVRTVVTDAGGRVVADRTGATHTVHGRTGYPDRQTVTIDRPHLWDGVRDPYLYHVTVEVHDAATGTLTDVVTQPLGLRYFAVNPSTGFSLNGRHLALHGVDLHQDRAGVGWAETDADRAQDFDLITGMGANAVRMAHYQHDQGDYTLADQDGLVVWAEIPLVDAVTDSPAFTATTEQQLRELISQNYNHPSIVFWSIGNEQNLDDRPTNTLLAALARIASTMDPARLSTYANCCISDIAAMTSHTDTSAYNRYYGWYYGRTRQFGSWADSLHYANPTRAIGLAEYGAGANPTQHSADPAPPSPAGPWHPEEYQALYHEQLWKQIASRPYLWGTFVWSMFDFASDARGEGGTPGINDKGLVTRDRRTEKDAYFWYKANWATTPTLYITSRRWTARTDPRVQIKVYSNATAVSAELNGAPLGRRTSGDRVFTWDAVTLRPGANTVTVTAVIGGEPRTDTVTWTLT